MKNAKTKRIDARWTGRLNYGCPYCDQAIQLSGAEDLDKALFEPRQVFPDKFQGEEVRCEACDERFLLTESEEESAYWVFYLVCECPDCGEVVELAEAEEPSVFNDITGDGEIELLFDTETTCIECGCVFIIDKPRGGIPLP